MRHAYDVGGVGSQAKMHVLPIELLRGHELSCDHPLSDRNGLVLAKLTFCRSGIAFDYREFNQTYEQLPSCHWLSETRVCT
jgi:hypothetical protein